jgi:hypothetical protein
MKIQDDCYSGNKIQYTTMIIHKLKLSSQTTGQALYIMNWALVQQEGWVQPCTQLSIFQVTMVRLLILDSSLPNKELAVKVIIP